MSQLIVAFSVKRTTGRRADGATKTVDILLHVAPLEKTKKYKFEDEDPTIYSDEEDYSEVPKLRCAFPKEDLHKRETVPKLTVDEERNKLIEKALDAHAFNVKLLATFGIDACKEYHMTLAQTILEQVRKDDRVCRICHKGLKSSHTLRSHIKTTHIKKTKHQCEICGRYYAEASGLKAHRNKHTGETIQCTKCDKHFGSKSQLNEHLQSHLTAAERGSICENCGKEFAHKRGWRGHIKWCGIPKELRARVKCKYCPKDFVNNKEKNQHVKIAHKDML